MKNKFKIFISVLITAIICISSTVYASYSYFAKDIGFTPKNEEWKVDNLEDAINDLYENKEESLVCNVYDSENFISSGAGTFYSRKIEVPSNIKKIYINSLISSTYGSYGINLNIDESLYRKEKKSYCAIGVICNYIEKYSIDTTNLKMINIDFTATGSGKHLAYFEVCY